MSIRRWLVKCQVNMDAGHEIKVTVKANTQRKAESKAIDTLISKGYFNVKVVSCKEDIPR